VSPGQPVLLHGVSAAVARWALICAHNAEYGRLTVEYAWLVVSHRSFFLDVSVTDALSARATSRALFPARRQPRRRELALAEYERVYG
jgi:hypothetical protein